MSKPSGWVPIDKGLVETLPHDRPYSHVEAMFSHAVDVDCGKEWSINGYASLWQWSRNKVRKFIQEIRTGRGHEADKKGTGKGHPVHYIDTGSWGEEDRSRTGRGQVEDRKRYTTIDPLILNPKSTKDYSVEGAQKGHPPYKEIIEYLNSKVGTKYKPGGKETRTLIRARWESGFRLPDFQLVIDRKTSEWLTDPKMCEYLRPQTLFGTKFESYLNAPKPGGKEPSLAPEPPRICRTCIITDCEPTTRAKGQGCAAWRDE